MSLNSIRFRRLSRPSAPSCRGGASSLLRLAQPVPRTADLAGWLQRASMALTPSSPWAIGKAAPSIITRLASSQELAAS